MDKTKNKEQPKVTRRDVLAMLGLFATLASISIKHQKDIRDKQESFEHKPYIKLPNGAILIRSDKLDTIQSLLNTYPALRLANNKVAAKITDMLYINDKQTLEHIIQQGGLALFLPGFINHLLSTIRAHGTAQEILKLLRKAKFEYYPSFGIMFNAIFQFVNYNPEKEALEKLKRLSQVTYLKNTVVPIKLPHKQIVIYLNASEKLKQNVIK